MTTKVGWTDEARAAALATRQGKNVIQSVEAREEIRRVGLNPKDFKVSAPWNSKAKGWGFAVAIPNTLKAHGDQTWITENTNKLRSVGATVTLFRGDDGRTHFVGAKFDGRGGTNHLGAWPGGTMNDPNEIKR